ncbi:AraC family transcriptional regulator ligand-binding domain-containing protein [Maricurvus nonylphenolicus]|uniref:AraC family transcriptional regulator n=1 Tax=Maricurvus nonylphenolicus TaxID=1008307 RepID=UPI0036F1E50E
MHSPLINSSFLDGFPQLVIDRGGDPYQLAKQVGFDSEIFEGKNTLIRFDRHVQLLDLAANTLDCPTLGLELAGYQNHSIFGPLASLALKNATVGESIEQMSKHSHIQVQGVEIRVTTSADMAQIQLHNNFPGISDSIRYQDHSLTIIYQLLQFVRNGHFTLRSVFFRHSGADDNGAYSRTFNCPVAFNQPFIGLSFEARHLDAPIAQEAKELPVILREHLETRHRDNLVDQVSRVISQLLVTEDCSIDTVAHAMGYSSRTLQRKLLNEDTNFQSLLNNVRCDQARDYLSNPYYRLTDIAAILGYSELSAFSRSFKRWFGISPQQWRKQVS